MSMVDPETEDWTQITEPRLRKRVQNRLSQRKHRQSLRQQRKGSLEVAPSSSQTPNTRSGSTVPRLAASSSHLDADEWNSQRSNIEHAKQYTAPPKTVDFDRWDGIDSFSSEVLEAPDLTTLSCDASSQISSWPAGNNINPQSRRPVDSTSIVAEPRSFLPPPPPPPSPALAQTGPKVPTQTVKNSFPAPALASAPWTLADLQELASMPRTQHPPLTCNPSTLSTGTNMTSAPASYGPDPRIYSCGRDGMQTGSRRPSNHLDNVMLSPLGTLPSPSSPTCLNMFPEAGRRGPERYESLRLVNGHGMLRI